MVLSPGKHFCHGHGQNHASLLISGTWVGVLFQAGSLARMPSSRLLRATRALVSELLSLAKAYKVVADVDRDSEAKEVLKAYRRVALKLHPDKGWKQGSEPKL